MKAEAVKADPSAACSRAAGLGPRCACAGRNKRRAPRPLAEPNSHLAACCAICRWHAGNPSSTAWQHTRGQKATICWAAAPHLAGTRRQRHKGAHNVDHAAEHEGRVGKCVLPVVQVAHVKAASKLGARRAVERPDRARATQGFLILVVGQTVSKAKCWLQPGVTERQSCIPLCKERHRLAAIMACRHQFRWSGHTVHSYHPAQQH